MSCSYAEKWSRSYKEALKPLTEAQARERHEAGKLYTVLLGGPERPRAIVETRDHYFGIEFLDDHLRAHTTYQFKRQPDGRLFMVMAVFRRFADDVKGAVFGQSLHFKTDGHVLSIEEDFRSRTETRTEKRMDVSLNWEPYPAFGNYASIARYDRDRPAADPSAVTSADQPVSH